MKKYLKRLAEDNFQMNRTYELLMNGDNFTDDDIFEFANNIRTSWESANADGYIEEKYDNFASWLNDYVMSISYDLIMKAKNDNEDFANNYALLNDVERDDLVEKVNEYVLTKSNDIEKALDNAR